MLYWRADVDGVDDHGDDVDVRLLVWKLHVGESTAKMAMDVSDVDKCMIDLNVYVLIMCFIVMRPMLTEMMDDQPQQTMQAM